MRNPASILPILIFCVLAPHALAAEPAVAELPTEAEFLQDDAELLALADRDAVKAACAKSFREHQLPVAVYTITTLGAGLTIENLATSLIKERAQREPNRHWEKGAVLIASKSDRKIRIEVGSSYNHTLDGSCDIIRDNTILPAFKEGHFSDGIRKGTDELADLLHDESVPHPFRNTIIGILLLLLCIAMVVSPVLLLFLVVRWLARRPRGSARRGWTNTDPYSTASSYDSSSSSSSSSDSTSSSSSSSSDSGGGSTGSW